MNDTFSGLFGAFFFDWNDEQVVLSHPKPLAVEVLGSSLMTYQWSNSFDLDLYDSTIIISPSV